MSYPRIVYLLLYNMLLGKMGFKKSSTKDFFVDAHYLVLVLCFHDYINARVINSQICGKMFSRGAVVDSVQYVTKSFTYT